jgi:hypothetical protein
VFALRLSNERDQAIVASAVADTGTGLLEFLPALGSREAIAFGDGVAIPVRIKFDEVPAHALPRSTTAKFSEKWQESMGDEAFLDAVVERWRAAGVTGQLDAAMQAQLFADAVSLPASVGLPRRDPQADRAAIDPAPIERPLAERSASAIERHGHEYDTRHSPFSPAESPYGEPPMAPPPPRAEPSIRRAPSDIPRAAPASQAVPPPPAYPPLRDEPPPRYQPAGHAPDAHAPGASNPRLALRERLLKPLNPR